MNVIIDDVAQYLEDNGAGTIGTDIFKSYLPDNTDTCIAVLDTGGTEPDPYLPTSEPTFQIFIRAADYATGRAKLDTVRGLLHRKRNAELVANETYFYFILAISEGGHVARNERGLDEFSMNFRCRVR